MSPPHFLFPSNKNQPPWRAPSPSSSIESLLPPSSSSLPLDYTPVLSTDGFSVSAAMYDCFPARSTKTLSWGPHNVLALASSSAIFFYRESFFASPVGKVYPWRHPHFARSFQTSCTAFLDPALHAATASSSSSSLPFAHPNDATRPSRGRGRRKDTVPRPPIPLTRAPSIPTEEASATAGMGGGTLEGVPTETIHSMKWSSQLLHRGRFYPCASRLAVYTTSAGSIETLLLYTVARQGGGGPTRRANGEGSATRLRGGGLGKVRCSRGLVVELNGGRKCRDKALAARMKTSSSSKPRPTAAITTVDEENEKEVSPSLASVPHPHNRDDEGEGVSSRKRKKGLPPSALSQNGLEEDLEKTARDPTPKKEKKSTASSRTSRTQKITATKKRGRKKKNRLLVDDDEEEEEEAEKGDDDSTSSTKNEAEDEDEHQGGSNPTRSRKRRYTKRRTANGYDGPSSSSSSPVYSTTLVDYFWLPSIPSSNPLSNGEEEEEEEEEALLIVTYQGVHCVSLPSGVDEDFEDAEDETEKVGGRGGGEGEDGASSSSVGVEDRHGENGEKRHDLALSLPPPLYAFGGSEEEGLALCSPSAATLLFLSSPSTVTQAGGKPSSTLSALLLIVSPLLLRVLCVEVQSSCGGGPPCSSSASASASSSSPVSIHLHAVFLLPQITACPSCLYACTCDTSPSPLLSPPQAYSSDKKTSSSSSSMLLDEDEDENVQEEKGNEKEEEYWYLRLLIATPGEVWRGCIQVEQLHHRHPTFILPSSSSSSSSSSSLFPSRRGYWVLEQHSVLAHTAFSTTPAEEEHTMTSGPRSHRLTDEEEEREEVVIRDGFIRGFIPCPTSSLCWSTSSTSRTPFVLGLSRQSVFGFFLHGSHPPVLLFQCGTFGFPSPRLPAKREREKILTSTPAASSSSSLSSPDGEEETKTIKRDAIVPASWWCPSVTARYPPHSVASVLSIALHPSGTVAMMLLEQHRPLFTPLMLYPVVANNHHQWYGRWTALCRHVLWGHSPPPPPPSGDPPPCPMSSSPAFLLGEEEAAAESRGVGHGQGSTADPTALATLWDHLLLPPPPSPSLCRQGAMGGGGEVDADGSARLFFLWEPFFSHPSPNVAFFLYREAWNAYFASSPSSYWKRFFSISHDTPILPPFSSSSSSFSFLRSGNERATSFAMTTPKDQFSFPLGSSSTLVRRAVRAYVALRQYYGVDLFFRFPKPCDGAAMAAALAPPSSVLDALQRVLQWEGWGEEEGSTHETEEANGGRRGRGGRKTTPASTSSLTRGTQWVERLFSFYHASSSSSLSVTPALSSCWWVLLVLLCRLCPLDVSVLREELLLAHAVYTWGCFCHYRNQRLPTGLSFVPEAEAERRREERASAAAPCPPVASPFLRHPSGALAYVQRYWEEKWGPSAIRNGGSPSLSPVRGGGTLSLGENASVPLLPTPTRRTTSMRADSYFQMLWRGGDEENNAWAETLEAFLRTCTPEGKPTLAAPPSVSSFLFPCSICERPIATSLPLSLSSCVWCESSGTDDNDSMRHTAPHPPGPIVGEHGRKEKGGKGVGTREESPTRRSMEPHTTVFSPSTFSSLPLFSEKYVVARCGCCGLYDFAGCSFCSVCGGIFL